MTNAVLMLSKDKKTVTYVCWSLGSQLWSFSDRLGFCGIPRHPSPPPSHAGGGWITTENAAINGLL